MMTSAFILVAMFLPEEVMQRGSSLRILTRLLPSPLFFSTPLLSSLAVGTPTPELELFSQQVP
jgi:hypothetical protein